MRYLPTDPNLIFSVVNTLLRDEYDSLDSLCEEEDWSRDGIVSALEAAGYRYDSAQNRFTV